MPSGRVQVLREVLRENPVNCVKSDAGDENVRSGVVPQSSLYLTRRESRGTLIVRIRLADSYFSPDQLPIHYYSRENLPSPDSSSRVTTIEKQTNSFR